jgi:Rab GDP dissociation inhibitor
MADEETKLDFAWLPAGTEALADGEYDAIVLGTGLKECILSGLLAVSGKKVLHLDRNAYYGGECASLNLTNLYAKFKPGQTPRDDLGANRDYNIDLIPKFIMACGKLVKMLLHTKVTRYLEFKNVDGSYVVKGGKTYKVPATGEEALRSSLMGMFEKRKFRKLLMYIYNYEEDEPKTFEGMDLFKQPMSELFEKFGVDANTQSFMGHAMALMRDESYISRPAIETVRAIKLYAYSLERYGKSPYIYPIYGLGGLPEGFSRLRYQRRHVHAEPQRRRDPL